MGTRTRRAAVAALALAVSGTALAADPPYPMGGRVYNTVENGWLTYECTPPENGLLTCSFVQTSIRQKTNAEEAAKQLAIATDGWPKSLAAEYGTTVSALYDSPKWKEQCAMADSALQMVDGQTPSDSTPETKRAFARMMPLMRKDLKAQFAAMKQSCQSRTLDGLKQFMELGLEQEQRTCEVGTNDFKQTFKPVYSADGKFQSWNVADTAPSGDCGFINLSRFVPVNEHGGTTYLWRYYARRVTTNPQSDLVLVKCKNFEEREYLYDWSPQTISLQCDYIKDGL